MTLISYSPFKVLISPSMGCVSFQEIVVVQMGDNQEVIATRKRMVEKIKQESNGSNKIHVVKKDKWKETHPIEGDISTLKGEYEINVIGRSTIQFSQPFFCVWL
jgi:hypothetical protein